MTVGVRPATLDDAGAIVALLNPIIARGENSAITEAIAEAEQRAFLRGMSPRHIYHLAEDADGTLLGLQWLDPLSGASAHVGDIATFAAIDAPGRGVGRALMQATLTRARSLDYAKIIARIRADNVSGLGFYRVMGFEEVGRFRKHYAIAGRLIDQVLTERHL
ncbi:MAG: GNAT family N-acetyltransferase [Pseudomonadota bacterium]